MKVKNIKIYLLLSLIVIYSLFYNKYIAFNLTNYKETITLAFLIIIAFTSYKLFGYKRDKFNDVKRSILITEIILLVGFFTVYYGLGLKMGFVYPQTLVDKNIINTIILASIIVVGEIGRYLIIKADKEDIINNILFIGAFSLLEIVFVTSKMMVTNYEELFKITAQYYIPITVKNYTLNYLVRYGGFRVTVPFNLIFSLYMYVLPFIPDVGEFLSAISKLTVPMLLSIASFRIVDESINGIEYDFKQNMFKKSDALNIILIGIVACIISGQFRFHLIGIGSESMSPKIQKGDAVLLDKKEVKKDLKIGTIVAYNRNGKLIIHRISKIVKKDNKKYYVTKGDANNSDDNVQLANKDIVGVVLFKIKFIGYPSVFLSENFKHPV
ncbi:MAG: signal peptidase I [Bacilli bacterium]|nr:signal peptidase I [Bacilli bacterium]